MALITCPECAGNVSSLAEECPHCGAPVSISADSECSLSSETMDELSPVQHPGTSEAVPSSRQMQAPLVGESVAPRQPGKHSRRGPTLKFAFIAVGILLGFIILRWGVSAPVSSKESHSSRSNDNQSKCPPASTSTVSADDYQSWQGEFESTIGAGVTAHLVVSKSRILQTVDVPAV